MVIHDPKFPRLSLESKNQSRLAGPVSWAQSLCGAVPVHPALLDGTIPDGHTEQLVSSQ